MGQPGYNDISLTLLKSIESLVGTKHLVYCSGYSTPTLSRKQKMFNFLIISNQFQKWGLWRRREVIS